MDVIIQAHPAAAHESRPCLAVSPLKHYRMQWAAVRPVNLTADGQCFREDGTSTVDNYRNSRAWLASADIPTRSACARTYSRI